MKKTKLTRSLLAACSIVVLSAVAYGCSSGISQSEADRQAAEAAAAAAAEAEAAAKKAAEEAAAKAEADRLAAIEDARQAIAAATTPEAAQAAKDAVDDIATATEAAGLQADVDARVAALAMMAREAEQKMALSDAAGMIDTSDLSTQDAVDAARAAIVMLRGALANAADVSDADKAMYMSMLDDAVMAVDAAQGGIDTATRRMNQMAALSGASDTLQAALAALAGQAPTQAQIDAASAALAALNMAITDGADLTDAEKATYQREADNAAAPISTAQSSLDDAEDKAEEERQKAEAEAAAKAAAAMAVTAGKLYAGLEHGLGSSTETRTAAYNDADAPTAGTATDTLIMVTSGTTADSPSPVPLSEDKDTTVAALDGWTGKRYTRTSPASEGTYEAIVYSNVEAPTMGRKFGAETVDQTVATRAYEYDLTDGELPSASFVAANVAFTGVTRTAGTETFHLPDPNDPEATNIIIPGSYHGVSGNYLCNPATDTAGCTAAVASGGGFTVSSGDAWSFKPSNAEARVMDAADTVYASYGWWLHKSADDSTYTASAFHDAKGAPTALVDATLNALQGTATYMGGAAGKYALSSSTGGTNDAGHFTARATLEADFGDDTAGGTITGTIDNFMGADGMARDWSVELKEATITAATPIATLSRTDADDTVWTIGGVDADASGEWSGSLRNQGDDGVPQVATGTFYTEYNRTGRMVGAFGANEQ